MAQKTKKTASKNVGNRAAEQAAIANHPTKHFCASPSCPTPHDRILLKDLQPVGRPRGPMTMYHKGCWASAR